MKLRASPFVTVPNSMMQKTYHSQDGHPLGVESLPVGLTEANMVLMEQACLEELEHKLANQTFISGIVCWRTSAVSKSILETVFRYYHTMPVVSSPITCILPTNSKETSPHPHNPATPPRHPRHLQPSNLHRLIRKDDPLPHANQVSVCRILLLAAPQPPTETYHLQNLPRPNLQIPL